MSIRNLEYLFRPKSVAVVGASDVAGSYGAVVLKNLMAGGFAGPILPVSVKHRSLFGLAAHPQVGELPFAPDLAVLCSPGDTLPEVVAQLAERGTRAAILTCPVAADMGTTGAGHMRKAMFDAARPHLMRILGPSSAGLIVPPLGLNASFAHTQPLSGRIAFVSQSAAVTAAVLDWACGKGIGFSCLLHLGESADVDLGDVLDYLASDPATDAIMLHFEALADGRKFMSAARAAVRNKPVVAIRPSHADDGAPIAATLSGSMASADDVYAAALRRAGIVRLFTTEGLFLAVEAMARAKPLTADRLAIVANGAGFGRIAADVLRRGGGRLAALSPQTTAALGDGGSDARQHNPLELAIDAPVERYPETLKTLLASEDNDAVLLIHAPTAFAPAPAVARAACDAAAQVKRGLLLTCWLGGNAVSAALEVADKAGIPSYRTPERAIEVFLGIVQYGRNRELLMQTPPSVSGDFQPDSAQARRLVAKALAAGREWLSASDAKAVLAAYGLPVYQPRIAHTHEEAALLAVEQGFPVALKVLVAGDDAGTFAATTVRNLESPGEVRQAARSLRQRVREHAKGVRVRGFVVQPMSMRLGAFELLLGVASDPVFGPVIVFGRGGPGADVVGDVAVALPPLNMLLARDMVARTDVSRLFPGTVDGAAVDERAICLALVQVSQLLADLDEVTELEINPLLADEHGVRVMDARVRIAPRRRRKGVRRFAIRPYPQELEQTVRWHGTAVLLRPIRPEDEPAHGAFLNALASDDARYRFFNAMHHLPHRQLARFTQIDYDREMAFLAIAPGADGKPETLGEARAVADPDNIAAEFAIVVRSDLKGRGLGQLLMEHLIAYLRERGTQELRGETLPDNERMKRLARDCGFTLTPNLAAGVVEMRLRLR